MEEEINQNGDYIRYTYDNYYNLIACYKGNINNNSVDSQEILCYTCRYDDQNNLTYYDDLIENKKYFYSYDLNNNLIKVTTTKTDENNNVTEDYIEYIYNDETKNIESTNICINGDLKVITYEYNNDEIESSQINNLTFTAPTELFDDLTKIIESQIKKNTQILIDSKYYFDNSTTSINIQSEDDIVLISSRIDKQVISINNGLEDYEICYYYQYDSLGNITQIKYNKVKVLIVDQNKVYEILEEIIYDYSYNYRNELSYEQITNNGKIILQAQYQYDDYGNIKKITRSNNTDYYGNLPSLETFMYNNYNELTSHTKDGITKTINYDSLRNITSYNDYTLIYDGTNLKEVRDSANQIIASYKYNAQGIRISKETTNEKIEYSYIGDKLYQEIRYSKQSNETTTINYIYDSTGLLAGFEADEQKYFYIRNLTNQIDYIVDDQGNIVAEYQYDAYGNIVNETNLSEIGQLNPIRYKGYYYDDTIELYYCISRYYSPTLYRFISQDSVEYLNLESVNGLNLYCYCLNNPIMYADHTGHFAISTLVWILIGTAVLVTAGTITYGAVTDTPVVLDLSASFNSGAGAGYKVGISIVFDFKNDNIEFYGHHGITYGVKANTFGFSYSPGVILNYENPGDYGGPFKNYGGGWLWGIDHCYNPRTNHSDAVQAYSITFGNNKGVYFGDDKYYYWGKTGVPKWMR